MLLYKLYLIKAIIKADIAGMKNNILKPLRLSSTLILNLQDDGPNCHKILMLSRKPHMSFSNSLVFPGGVCEEMDASCLQSDNFSQYAKITAIRQTLQETGLLLLPTELDQKSIDSLRKSYRQKEFKIINEMIGKEWRKYLDLLLPIARFVTPQIKGMSRFDTYFYLVSTKVKRINLGLNEPIEILEINKMQSTNYFWKSPEEYLDLFAKKQIFLPPPQQIILTLLSSIPKEKPLSHYIHQANITIQPILFQFHKGMAILPGDQSYNHLTFKKDQPQSKTKQQIGKYIQQKEVQRKKESLRRIVQLSIIPENQYKRLQFVCSEPETTLLIFNKSSAVKQVPSL